MLSSTPYVPEMWPLTAAVGVSMEDPPQPVSSAVVASIVSIVSIFFMLTLEN